MVNASSNTKLNELFLRINNAFRRFIQQIKDVMLNMMRRINDAMVSLFPYMRKGHNRIKERNETNRMMYSSFLLSKQKHTTYDHVIRTIPFVQTKRIYHIRSNC